MSLAREDAWGPMRFVTKIEQERASDLPAHFDEQTGVAEDISPRGCWRRKLIHGATVRPPPQHCA